MSRVAKTADCHVPDLRLLRLDADSDGVFAEAVPRICRSRPDRVWLSLVQGSHETHVTCAALQSRVESYVEFYRSQGLRAGDTVLIILKESLDLFAAFFAGIVHGALPAFFAYPSPKQRAEQFVQSITDLIRCNHIRLVVGFGEALAALSSHEVTKSKDLLGVFDSAEIADVVRASTAWTPRAEAFLQFSSGTTGAKKGVKISSKALLNQIQAYEPVLDYDASSKVISWLPQYHDMGLIACMLMPFLRQVPIVMMSPFEWVQNPKILLEAITRHRGTHVWLPNFALGHLSRSVSNEELRNIDLSSLKRLVCCSEPMLPETVERFIAKFRAAGLDERVIVNCYAMAENVFAMTTARRGPPAYLEVDAQELQVHGRINVGPGGKRIASAGPPLVNTRIRILDGDQHTVNEDVVGEVAIQSDCMLEEYHNNREATADAFVDGWFRTGDLGFLHDGELYVTGRKKDVIIVGGENIYPHDIQVILDQEPYLQPGRNVVFGVDDERVGTERIVVLAEVSDDRLTRDLSPLKQKIFNALNISVAEIRLLPPRSLRKSTAGKISNHLNKLEYLQGTFSAIPAAAMESDELRRTVLSVIPARMPITLEEDTSLMESGLIDSFGFVEMIHALEASWQLTIPQEYWTSHYFESLKTIRQTLKELREGRRASSGAGKVEWDRRRAESLQRLLSSEAPRGDWPGFWERIINGSFLRGSGWYRFLLRRAGVQVGKKMRCLGGLHVKLRGKPANIQLGDDVILGDGVSLRNRENGRIVLETGSYLDDHVRLVAARDGIIHIGRGTTIGIGTVINSGGQTRIGRFVLIGSNVSINSSDHGMSRGALIKEQGYEHGTVEIGDDVWIGAGAAVLMNAKIGEGAIIGANAVVSGEVPAFAIVGGAPARVLRYRS